MGYPSHYRTFRKESQSLSARPYDKAPPRGLWLSGPRPGRCPRLPCHDPIDSDAKESFLRCFADHVYENIPHPFIGMVASLLDQSLETGFSDFRLRRVPHEVVKALFEGLL